MSLPKCSERLSGLPPYLFVKLNAVKEKAVSLGLDLIDLGMGNPDRPSPDHVVEALSRAAKGEPWTHRYPQTKGLPALRSAIADWYGKRFGVRLDPETEVLPLVGSKEGLAHLFFAYLTPKDVALVPSPCYPVHYNAPLLAGAKVRLVPLKEENGFLPELHKIPASAARRAKVLTLNYPNNPTGAVVENLDLFKEAVRFARRHGAMVLHDNAYSEICFDGYRAPSFLEVPEARSCGVEFHSLSKTYSMAGWRVAFAVGNAEILGQLSKFKSFLDYGVPSFIQMAAAEALRGPQECVTRIAEVYRARRDALVRALAGVGWKVRAPKASMYLWARVPEPFEKAGSFAFAERLILEEGVVLAPGIGFGPYGEGFVRFALVGEVPRLSEAARRIGRFLNGSGPRASGVRIPQRAALSE